MQQITATLAIWGEGANPHFDRHAALALFDLLMMQEQAAIGAAEWHPVDVRIEGDEKSGKVVVDLVKFD